MEKIYCRLTGIEKLFSNMYFSSITCGLATYSSDKPLFPISSSSPLILFGGHPDPQIRGTRSPKKCFSALRVLVNLV